MKLVLLFSIVIMGFFITFICVLLLKYIKLAEEYTRLTVYLKKISHVVNSARYGNFEARVDRVKNKLTDELSKSLNSLFESVLDRDSMINEYIQKEKETNNLKEDFIATLTHDLKVPIIAQDNTLELLLNKKFGEITEPQELALRNLKISNMDLKYLVEALLETYKMEHKGIEVKKTKGVNLQSFLKEIISQIQSIADVHDKKINFISKIEENFTADIDTFLIRRVINNLMLNALLYSINSKNVDVILRRKNDSIIIDIKDYGMGIDKEEVKKIFKKYYTCSSKFLRSGTGLGLYLSNKIINEHGGTIDVISKKQEGSTFAVNIPCA